MDGRRFGVGLVGGLTFALFIVGISGLVSWGPLSGGATSGASVQVTATSTTNAGTLSATTTPAVVPIAYGQTTTTVSGNMSSINNTVKSLGSNSTAITNAQGYGPANGFSSSLASIARLPTVSRALLLAPILAAFLLGALIYRASMRKSGSEDE